MKKNRVLAIILLVAMLIVTTGCGGGNTSGDSGNGGEQKTVDYPKKSINLVVPYAAGGSSDMSARPLADKMQAILGQPIVVKNTAGAGGAIGTAEVVRSAADGYTLLNASIGPLTITPYSSEVGYTYEDFKPIAQITDIPIALAVNSKSSITSLEEFVAEATSKNGALQVGNVGAGNIQHLAMEFFATEAGLKVTHVPYEGANPAVAALLGQHVDSICVGVTELTPHYNRGDFRILAVMANERVDSMPDVPTFKELGYDDVQFGIWYGIVAPKDTPDEVVAILDKAVGEALQDATVLENMEKLFLIVSYHNSAEFKERIVSDAEKNKAVLEALGMAKK